MSESRRPGRHRAGSSCSGRLVAPMTNTFFLEVMPSISIIWLAHLTNRPRKKHDKLTSEQLVDNAVRCTASIANRPTTGLGNGVQLVEEHDARGGGTGLVEDVADVALRLAEPHAEKFRALHRNEIGSALVGNGLGQHSL